MGAVETDVVVVGAGNAALTAALAAREAGAEVTVLEAAPEGEHGGNSRYSDAIFRIPHEGASDLRPLLADEARPWIDRVAVTPYPSEAFERDLIEASGGRSDRELVGVLVGEAYETVSWMGDRGVRWKLAIGKLHDPDRADREGRYALPPGGELQSCDEGVGLVEGLRGAASEAGVETVYEATAEDLVVRHGRVAGVRARIAGEEAEVVGKVVLACGGFEASPELRIKHLGPDWDRVKVRGTRFNDGRLLERAIAAGARPYGEWSGCHATPVDADAPELGEIGSSTRVGRYSYPYGLMVNLDGERFIDEGGGQVWHTYAKTGEAIRRQPGGVAVQVFDRKGIDLLDPAYRDAAAVEADDIRGLAVELGIDPDALERTVETYNDATSVGAFDPYREDGLATGPGLSPPKSNWALPLDEPPFRGYRVACGITFTYGGLRIDTRARVLDHAGAPIPGLFATGEITGGFFYGNYPGGSGLTRGAVFGRIAGREAATS